MTEINKRILVIDDDQDLWKAYRLVLEPNAQEPGSEKAGIYKLLGSAEDEGNPEAKDGCYQVSYADQGNTGFGLVEKAVAEDAPFAVAFIDVRMPPGWDGMKTAGRIRSLDKNIEIVIVTAYSDRSCEEIIKKVGSPDKLLFIRKPFDSEELRKYSIEILEMPL